MSDLPTSLRMTLADRYAVERELGQGGMATVYLAQDLKHNRLVAIKVLRQEVAAVLGAERFLREIETTAGLRHPHILPLFDSGKAGSGEEVLWYAMPFVEGESLRDRLERDKQLPLEEALQVAREVGDALAYAHSRGVIHRDIKPENILLESGHAVVADFGIAKAITAAGGGKLTGTGLAIGTPSYMSPEQALGQDVDGRSDIYALGCVLYEMLVGEPPYTGPSAQAIIARRLSEPLPSLRVVREAVPAGIEAAVHKALARAPADRFATAGQFVGVLAGDGKTEVRKDGRTRPVASRWWLIPAAVLATVAVAIGVLRSRRASPGALDPNLIAVFPFRMSGTDTSFALLRDGMVDFLETKFSGEGGPRVLPTRTALAAWHRGLGANGEEPTDEAAARLARGLGAGSLVLGTLVTTPGHLTISGTLIDAASGRPRAQAKVEGTPDSLAALVDSFAIQLVALGAGEQRDRLASLTTTSLPALYAYLAGRAAHRVGQFGEAMQHFDRALELDSTFALAALADVQSAGWADWRGRRSRLKAAQAHRDRLGPRERLFLDALRAGEGPDRIPVWEEVVRQTPDDPDGWTQLGDAYFHVGALAGRENPNQLAADALERALALDTMVNVEPMIHLLQIAEVEGDTAKVRRLFNLYPSDVINPHTQVLAAAVLHDTAMLALAWRNMDSLGGANYLMMMDAQTLGVGVPEAERAMQRYLARAQTPADSVERYGFDAYIFLQQLGRPAAAAAAFRAAVNAIDHGGNSIPAWRHGVFQVVTMYSLFGEVDSATTSAAVQWLMRQASAPPSRNAEEAEQQRADLCILTHWRLVHRDTTGVHTAIARLKNGDCYPSLRALLAAIEQSPDTGSTLRELESRRKGWAESYYQNLEIARLLEARGDVNGALTWIRRRPGYQANTMFAYPLREEGRLAVLAGDREGAIRAYRHYLALRYNPEPSVKPAVDSVRAELARLVGEQ